jgi:valyl-tRNA synthetase
MTELSKTFDPAAIEAKWYARWEADNAFRPARPDAEPYTIVMPPPNVTGSLHIGHALDLTLPDILIRHARMNGKDALWVVGTDHAGIATQMVVERQLNARGEKRTDFSREDFVAKVWDWKHESGGMITGQLRRLGASCDWENERFTMDEGFSKAVIKVFVDLFNQGLLYRDKRLVNWDPHFKTAISDLEVETREVQGQMWHFKYPLAGGETYTYVERDADGAIAFQEERDYISIATTRPETMLGDGAVAVHPGDARYAPIVGKLCEIPVGPKAHRRLIPIITDEYPDPDFGSGAVKITGAHDQNDYGVAQRNGIPLYRLMDDVAAMRIDGAPYAEAAAHAKAISAGEPATPQDIDALNLVPDVYRGLDRYEARTRVVADIDAEGLMLRVEDKTIMQPFGDRSGVVIEPMLTDQWYVDAKTLAQPAIEAVRSGAIKVVPQAWEKTWFQWLENIQPWCVSRQLWWGHRIPAWYGDDGKIYVAETETAAQEQAGPGVVLTQDEDVLDTWFSSALWPFGTLGWPEGGAPKADFPELVEGPSSSFSATEKQGASTSSDKSDSALSASRLAKHYPNDILISGFDILFFWDARMAMQGLHFMKEVPWKTLYLHGLVRAPDGSKMSKSKGNAVDPLGLIDTYGADALRFTLAAMESQGRDIKLDEKRVEGYRNFATKLWNAARFLQGNGVGASTSAQAPEATLAVNKWIIGGVFETLAKLDAAIADLRYDAMADTIYHFAWGTFCDWYIELVKGGFEAPSQTPPIARGDSPRGERGRGTQASTGETPTRSPGGESPSPTREVVEPSETQRVAAWAFDQILVMLHPFMPFITEELWHAMGAREASLIHAQWPQPHRSRDGAAKTDVERLIRFISDVRAARTELGVAPGAKMAFTVTDASPETRGWLDRNALMIARLARIEQAEGKAVEGASIEVGLDEAKVRIPLGGALDLDAERARLTKSAEAAEKEAASLAARLANPAFVEKAKPEAVEKARADHAEKGAEAERLRAALARLG